MAIKKIIGVYVKPSDALMWAQFERLARRLRLSNSGAATQAAREWTDRHQHDPSPDPVLPPDNRRGVIDFDPFAADKA